MKHLFSLLSLLLAVNSSSAQPARANAGAAMKLVTAEYSYSGSESLDRAGPAGGVAVHHSALSAENRRAVSATDTFAFGLEFELNSLDTDPGTPLPQRLVETALSFTLNRQFSPRWNATVSIRPGLYGDFETIDEKMFNAPLLAGAAYAPSRNLVWLFGLRANVYSEFPVIPFVGVRWQFDPQWSLNIAFPRSGIRWQVSPDLALGLGINLQGGTYRVSDNLGTPPGMNGRLANTFVDYREIRVGVGAEYAMNKLVLARADLGAFTNRRFDYFDRDYTLDGDAGIFAAVSLRTTF